MGERRERESEREWWKFAAGNCVLNSVAGNGADGFGAICLSVWQLYKNIWSTVGLDVDKYS